MTDQTPRTEAGRLVAEQLVRAGFHPTEAAKLVLAIEAQARTEAAERVRALKPSHVHAMTDFLDRAAVLAILDGETDR